MIILCTDCFLKLVVMWSVLAWQILYSSRLCFVVLIRTVLLILGLIVLSRVLTVDGFVGVLLVRSVISGAGI